MVKILFVLLTLFSTTVCLAQFHFTMPLKTGNKWVYLNRDRLFPRPVAYRKMTVGDSVLAENGHIYYQVFDGTQLPSGMYFVKIRYNHQLKTLKLLLMK